MINERCSKLLQEVIREKYSNIRYENIHVSDEEFYYEFKCDEVISENDFPVLEEEIRGKDNIFVKLLRISGVYLDGDSSKEMIVRIVGKGFASSEAVKEYEEFLEDAKERDHRKIGQELDLFCFSDYVGPGLPLYSPRGCIVKDELQREIERVCRKYGFQKVSCPSLADISLFETSGHAMKFNDELFRVESPKGHKYVLKPVQCPHHTQIYASKLRSYRDLPIRYMESDKQYRAELQGAVGGLSRVYAITVEDGHSFCTREQVKQEVMNMCNLIKDFYSNMGLYDVFWVSLSVRDYEHPEKYIGSKEDWDICENMLAEICEELGLTQEDRVARVSYFYTQLTLDGRFVTLGENVWDLRIRHTFDKVHIDMNEVYSEDEEELEFIPEDDDDIKDDVDRLTSEDEDDYEEDEEEDEE